MSNIKIPDFSSNPEIPDWLEVDPVSQTITVDGVLVSREVFRWLAEDANAGKKFRLISKDKYGAVELLMVEK